MFRFLVVWLGQVLAGCGSNLATFCLGIWLYRQSGSVTQFSLLMFFHTVPSILLAGVAGRVADRWNRRRTIMVADAVSALVALLYLCMFKADLAQAWLIYVLAFVGGSMSAFQWPAYRSWSTELVEPRDYGRIGGIMKLGEGIPFLLGPVLGGLLMDRASLSTVFAIDLAAYVAAVGVLATVRGHGASPPAADDVEGPTTAGWAPLIAFLRGRPGLSGLLVLAPFIVFTEGWVVVLFQLFMLHHVDAAQMGLVLSLGGTGMVVGGVIMGVWGGPRRQVYCVLGAILVQSILVGALALTKPGFWLGTTAAFLYFLTIPFLSGSNQAIWQTVTPSALQGRMFALRRATESVATPASMLTAGVLVDFVLVPMLASDGPFSFVGTIVPSGAAQGIAVLFLLVMLLNLGFLTFALSYRPLRNVDLLPAAHVNDSAAAARHGLHTVEAGANPGGSQ